MTRFDTICVVDWSAAKPPANPAKAKPKKDAIWAGVARAGVAEVPVFLPDRASAEAWLTQFITDEHKAGRRLMVSFDFPFGYPAGFARAVTEAEDTLALWAWLAKRVVEGPDGANRYDVAEQINGMFDAPGPFWGKSHKDRNPGIPYKKQIGSFDFAYKRAIEEKLGGTFSCFQLAGAGSVGSQVLTGLPVLHRLRQLPGVAAWPLEPWQDAPVVLTECWPGLIEPAVKAAGPGIRDAHQVRLLSLALSTASKEQMDAMLSVDAPEEGWILGADHSELLTRLAQPKLSPPPLTDDCFALPPGVDWTPVDQALERLRQRLHPVVGMERVRLADAEGRILVEDAIATRSNPPAANSAVDGYGFAAASLPDSDEVRLPLAIGRAAAGQPFLEPVPAGHAVRILTGALLPDGVDTVVLEEDVTTDGTQIAFRGPLRPGANARAAGEDVSAGATVLEAGQVVDAPACAILAATGVTEVAVHSPLRVGVLSTGHELAEAGTTPDPARTYDANRPMLLALLREWGMTAVDLGHVPDDRAKLRAALDDAAGRTDAILTSGGASAGDEDHVSALLGEATARYDWRIALKPGRPLALGMWQGTPIFGLPGNPVAAFVCTLVFARPAFGALRGEGWHTPQRFTVPAAFSKRKKPGRTEYLRARLNADGHAEVFKSEGSGRISGLSWADGLVEIDHQERTIAPGDPVTYLPLSGFR